MKDDHVGIPVRLQWVKCGDCGGVTSLDSASFYMPQCWICINRYAAH